MPADSTRHAEQQAPTQNRPGTGEPTGSGERIETAVHYVRSRELAAMLADLEGEVRRHPITAMAIAFIAGYLVRRLL